MRLPVHVATFARRVTQISLDLEQRTGHEPALAEVAAALDVTPEAVTQALNAQQRPVSLEAMITEDGHGLGEVLSDDTAPWPEDVVHRTFLRQHVRAALATLPARERLVLQLRFGLEGHRPHTLEEIGRRLGMTRERVRQLEGATLRHLQASDVFAGYERSA
jgi:RNA polymerase primary sigma factor